MKQSESRILITHTGSLPRPRPLVDLQLRMSRGESVAPGLLRAEVERATRRAVDRQLECGIDVGNDGEQPRESFFTYVRYRMSGFGGEGARPPAKDVASYPTFRELYQTHARKSLHTAPPRAVGEVRYIDRSALDRELTAYRRILGQQRKPFLETFW